MQISVGAVEQHVDSERQHKRNHPQHFAPGRAVSEQRDQVQRSHKEAVSHQHVVQLYDARKLEHHKEYGSPDSNQTAQPRFALISIRGLRDEEEQGQRQHEQIHRDSEVPERLVISERVQHQRHGGKTGYLPKSCGDRQST